MAQPVPVPQITDNLFINGAKDIINLAIGQIPKNYQLLPSGDLRITLNSNAVVILSFQEIFALLTTAFDDILPTQATPDTPGTILKADPENPADLASQQRYLSAPDVIDLIEKLLQDSVVGLQDTLDKVDTADRSVKLTGGGFELVRLILGTLTKVAEFRLMDDQSASLLYKGTPVINFDDKTVRLNALATLVLSFLKAETFGLTKPDNIVTPDAIAAFQYDNASSSNKLGKLTRENLLKWLNIDTTIFGDVDAIRQKIINAESVTYTPLVGYGKDLVTGKIIEYSISKAFADYATSGGNSSGWVNEYAGCRTEYKRAQMEDMVTFNQQPILTQQSHNLQTTSENIGVDGVFIFSQSDNYWIRQDESLSRFLEFPLSSDGNYSEAVRFRADAPANLSTLNVRVFIRRMIPI